MWPNETRGLICIGAADYGELYTATTNVKEVGDAGSGGESVELNAGVALLPDAHPPLHLVMGHLTEVLLPHPKRKRRRATQLSLFDRPLDDVVIAG
jgi:hypothetical protein